MASPISSQPIDIFHICVSCECKVQIIFRLSVFVSSPSLSLSLSLSAAFHTTKISEKNFLIKGNKFFVRFLLRLLLVILPSHMHTEWPKYECTAMTEMYKNWMWTILGSLRVLYITRKFSIHLNSLWKASNLADWADFVQQTGWLAAFLFLTD